MHFVVRPMLRRSDRLQIVSEKGRFVYNVLEPAPQGHVGASALGAVGCEYGRGVKCVAKKLC